MFFVSLFFSLFLSNRYLNETIIKIKLFCSVIVDFDTWWWYVCKYDTYLKLRSRKFGSASPGISYLPERVYISRTCTVDVRNFGIYTTMWEQGVSNLSMRVLVHGCLCNPKGMVRLRSSPFIKVISSARLHAHFLNSTHLFPLPYTPRPLVN